MLRVLNVAYPLIPVRAEAPGGTEQVLYALLRALSAPPYAGEISFTTVARAGSSVPGALVETATLNGQPAAESIDANYEDIIREQNQQVLDLLRSGSYSLVHNQGGSFYRIAAEAGRPVLVTLHLARELYPTDLLNGLPENLWLQFVSRSQYESYLQDAPPELKARFAGWIANGIDVLSFTTTAAKQDFLLFIGRICYEKAPHLAIKLGRLTRRKVILVGSVYPFSAHQQYFKDSVQPQLGSDVVWIEAPSAEKKRELLAHAAAVVIPSLVSETSSLVAMEAAASGTAVLAFRRGALPEVIRDSETGFLGASVDELAGAAAKLSHISPVHCREVAEKEFSAQRMAREYFELYKRIAGK